MSVCSFGSRADLNRLPPDAATPSWIHVGAPVQVLSSTSTPKSGVVQFVGLTEFASGTWIGVELDTADGEWSKTEFNWSKQSLIIATCMLSVFVQGKNDGAVKGVRYFRCRARHGVFVRHDKLVMDKKRNRRSVGRTSPMTSHSPSSASVRRSTSNLSAQTPTKSPGDVSVPSYMRSTYSSNAK